MPAPPTDLFTSVYERGSQAELITGAATTVTQTGTARPATAKAYGMMPILQRGALSSNIGVQLDINRDAGTGAFSALTFNILASADGVNYYVVATIVTAAGAAGFFQVSGLVTRYLSCSITTATVGSGAPQATISFVA